MITVSFSGGKSPLRVLLGGHANHGNGEFDMLCAAVTSAVRLFECVINDVAKAEAQVDIGEDGRLAITVKDPNQTVSDMFLGFYKLVTEYEKEYPQHIKVECEE